MPEVHAFLFGVTLALGIGPIALLILSVSATDGFRVGLRSALGAGVADFTLAVVALLSGTALSAFLVSIAPQLRAISAITLVLLGAWLAYAAFRRGRISNVSPTTVVSMPFLQTYALTLANPLGLLVFIAFATQLPVATSPLLAIWFAVCLFGGSVLVQVCLVAIGHFLSKGLASPGIILALNLLSSLGIAIYGAISLTHAVA